MASHHQHSRSLEQRVGRDAESADEPRLFLPVAVGRRPVRQTNTKTCHPSRSRPPPRNPYKTEDEDENDDEEERGEFLADYGFGVGAAPSVFSGAMNFRAMLIPMRIICNWFVWNLPNAPNCSADRTSRARS